jgi:class 3 adenylate cyclase
MYNAAIVEPRIQYARTGDGIRLAYFAIGSGTPLVMMPAPMSNILGEWHVPGAQEFHENLGRGHTLVRYDARGMGLSDREVTEFSVDTFIEDLKAIVDHLKLERFALHSGVFSVPAAIKYAALNPERLTHLVFWCGSPRGSDFLSRRSVAIRPVRDQDWEMYAEIVAYAVSAGAADAEATRKLAESVRDGSSAGVTNAVSEMNRRTDVTEYLSQIRAPTLVIHAGRAIYPPLSAAREMVATIPDAELLVLDESSGVPFFGDTTVLTAAIRDFMGDPQALAPPRSAAGLRTVLFTDLVGHSEMMSRLGDERGREVLREHERITREVLKDHGGTEVKTMGDGFMASFGSVTSAVECAVALQRAFADRDGEPLNVRVGLNAGEPIEEDGDLFGATVILASRIAAKADGGEILVADTVRGLCSGKGFLFADRGEFVAKGFEEPVRVYEVSWRHANAS